MKLRVSGILKQSDFHYPRKISSVVYLAGVPFKSIFSEAGDNAIETTVESLYTELSAQSKEVDAIVFSGAEPLMQSNSLRSLLPMLKGDGFSTKIDTNGFYPESLRDLLPFLDYVSMDLKTRFDEKAYAKATGNLAPGEVVVSNVLRSLAFLENSRYPVFREFSITLIEGENDDFQTIESLSSYVKKYCDLFTLRQFEPENPLAPEHLKQKPQAPKEKIFELAMMARNILPNVSVSIKEKKERLK